MPGLNDIHPKAQRKLKCEIAELLLKFVADNHKDPTY